jgi:uncharacterized membrane protein
MEPTLVGAAAPDQSTKNRSTLTLVAGGFLLIGAAVLLWAAPFTYDVYKGLHIVAALIWVGGGATLTLLGIVAERQGDSRKLAAIGEMGEWIGMRVYTPASFIVLVFGILMVEKGDLGWGHFWIDAALVGWLGTTAVGVLYLSPQTKKLGKLVEAGGPESPEAQAKIRQILTVIRFDAVMLLLIVVDMAAKPFS